jgi:protein TonB
VAQEAPPQDVAPGPQFAQAEPEPTPELPEPPPEESSPPEPVPEPVATPIEEQLPPPPLPLPPPQIELPKLPEVAEAQAVLPPPPPRPKLEKKPAPPKPRKVVERRRPVERNRTRVERSAAPAPGAAAAPSVSPASWRNALVARLNRFRRTHYSASVKTATVTFTIDGAGVVTGARLVASSGDPVLDAEALSLPRRASPLPEPPAGRATPITVPIRFYPR